MTTEYNLYDRPKVDPVELFQSKGRYRILKNPLNALYRQSWIPLRLRGLFWRLLTQTHVDLFWFYDFRRYWSECLGLRPLWGVEDFYYLRSLFRSRFQYLEVADSTSSEEHMVPWRRPEMLYFLMQQVYVESKHREFEIFRLFRKHHRGPRSFLALEYGAGIAPITRVFIDFFKGASRAQFTISDLETVAFHHGVCRFKEDSNVRAIPLRVDNELHLPASFQEPQDVIFCITVFEHLHEPLRVMDRFHALLKPGGLLFFDYIKSDGGGLDTQAGVREREQVLRSVRDRFELLEGHLDASQNLGLTVVRKR
jgi:SAM-dependent methyltransferase